MLSFNHVSQTQIMLWSLTITALANFDLLSKHARLIVLIRRILMKPSHHPSWLSPKSTFLPSLNNSRFRIFSLSRGTFSSSSSLRFLGHKFSLIASSFDKAGKMNTPFSFRTVLFSWAFVTNNLASCSI